MAKSEKVDEVVMPLMGEGITEATLVKWLKRDGEWVEKDAPLLEVSTDKVDTEIPSPATGYLLKTLVKEQEVVPINSVIAFISNNKDAAVPVPGATPARAAAAATASAKDEPGARANIAHLSDYAPEVEGAGPQRELSGGEAGRRRSSPLVRKIARDMNLNLGAVSGRGLNGRITKKDIFNFLDSVRSGIKENFEPAWHNKTLTTTSIHGQEFLDGVPVRREKMTKQRALIAEHMTRSVATSPHATTVFEMDLEQIFKLRKTHKDSFFAQENFNLTYTHFITYACVQALKDFPSLNCSVDGNELLFKDDINIGMAVALETNLLVPVLKRCQEKNFLELCRDLNDLVTRARNKKLNPDEVQGGTFSITNPGIFGSLTSNPIINQPQVAILCMGILKERPVVVDAEIVIRPLMHIGVTFDHRAVDGEGAAKFLASLQKNLESFAFP